MSTHRIIFAALKLIRVGLILFATATIGFGQAGNRPVLIFTGIANPESFDNPANEYRAAILIFDRKVWRLIYFPQQYENAGWMYSGRSKNKPEAWGIAQFGRGDIGEDLEIAHSLDEGRIWKHLRSLKKISRLATFESFSMSANGGGRLTVRLEDNVDSDHRDGYYTYTTVNGGRTWSVKPTHSTTAPLQANNNSLEPIPIRGELLPCLDSSHQP